MIVSVFVTGFLLFGCSGIFAESSAPAEENYDKVISKTYSTTRKVSLTFSQAKKAADKTALEKFLEEKNVPSALLTGPADHLIYKRDDVNYLVEPTVWVTRAKIQNEADIYTFVDNTRWGSIVCVDMSSYSNMDELREAMEKLIYVYRYAGYSIVSPYELYASDERLRLEDDTDPVNYPSLTTPVPLGLEKSNPVNDSYFDDVVFIGDSITQKLQMYVAQKRRENPDFLGDAKFLCSASLGAANSLSEVTDESLHPAYNGVKREIWDNVAHTGANKVYIMLGVNDLTWASTKLTISNLRALIAEIKKASPDVRIYVQSVTPRVARYEGNLNNRKIFEYDLELLKMCREDGYYFVDVASAMRDENGCLPDVYCSDMNSLGIHFTNEACDVWVDYLRTHTP